MVNLFSVQVKQHVARKHCFMVLVQVQYASQISTVLHLSTVSFALPSITWSDKSFPLPCITRTCTHTHTINRNIVYTIILKR